LWVLFSLWVLTPPKTTPILGWLGPPHSAWFFFFGLDKTPPPPKPLGVGGPPPLFFVYLQAKKKGKLCVRFFFFLLGGCLHTTPPKKWLRKGPRLVCPSQNTWGLGVWFWSVICRGGGFPPPPYFCLSIFPPPKHQNPVSHHPPFLLWSPFTQPRGGFSVVLGNPPPHPFLLFPQGVVGGVVCPHPPQVLSRCLALIFFFVEPRLDKTPPQPTKQTCGVWGEGGPVFFFSLFCVPHLGEGGGCNFPTTTPKKKKPQQNPKNNKTKKNQQKQTK